MKKFTVQGGKGQIEHIIRTKKKSKDRHNIILIFAALTIFDPQFIQSDNESKL